MARGMAADEPIVSQASTEEFLEGFARTFGERPQREPGRRTYVYRGGRLVEQGGPDDTGFYAPEDEARNHVVSDSYMDGVTAHDREGKVRDIGSRAKRRAFMRDNDYVDSDDFKGEWQRKAKEREAYMKGERRDPALHDAVGRALYRAGKIR